jgi:hypothetical protein
LSIEETQELHSQADVDNDGSLSLSEVIASPAAEKLSALPRPVSPVRRPVNRREPAQPQESNKSTTDCTTSQQSQPVQQHPQYPQPSSSTGPTSPTYAKTTTD